MTPAEFIIHLKWPLTIIALVLLVFWFALAHKREETRQKQLDYENRLGPRPPK